MFLGLVVGHLNPVLSPQLMGMMERNHVVTALKENSVRYIIIVSFLVCIRS